MDAYNVLLGEILIQRKRITREQLETALALQKKDRSLRMNTQGPASLDDKLENGFIGEILVKLGFLDEQDIVAALVIQWACRILRLINILLTRRLSV